MSSYKGRLRSAADHEDSFSDSSGSLLEGEDAASVAVDIKPRLINKAKQMTSKRVYRTPQSAQHSERMLRRSVRGRTGHVDDSQEDLDVSDASDTTISRLRHVSDTTTQQQSPVRRIGMRKARSTRQATRIQVSDSDNSENQQVGGPSKPIVQMVKRPAKASPEPESLKLGPPRKRRKQISGRSQCKTKNPSVQSTDDLSTSYTNSTVHAGTRQQIVHSRTALPSLIIKGDQGPTASLHSPPPSQQTHSGSRAPEMADDEHVKSQLSEIAKGKLLLRHLPPSHSTNLPVQTAERGTSVADGVNDVPKWTTLQEEQAEEPPLDVRGKTPPKQWMRCPCRRPFLREGGSKHIFCDQCRYRSLMQHGHREQAMRVYPNGPPGDAESFADELRDEQEVEAATFMTQTSPYGADSSRSFDTQHLSVVNGDESLPTGLENSSLEAPIDVTAPLAADLQASTIQSDRLDGDQTSQAPSAGSKRTKAPSVSKLSSYAHEFHHFNDLVYNLAGITNSIRPSKTSQPSTGQIRFRGVVLRALDHTKWPQLPIVNERLLNEITSEVKEKIFLPFILPKEQFEDNDGRRRGVTYRCQCLEDVPGERCPGRLKVTVTSVQAERGVSAIKIHVALDH